MSSPAQPDAHAPTNCALCGAAVPPGSTRCRSCGLYQQLGARRPNPFTRGSLWALALLLLAAYVLALVIVFLAR